MGPYNYVFFSHRNLPIYQNQFSNRKIVKSIDS